MVGHSDINLPSGSTDSYPFVARTDPAKSKITLKPVRSDGEVGDLFTVYLNVVGIPEPSQVQDFTGKVVTDGTKLSWSYGDVRGEGFEIRRQDKKTGVIDGTFSIKKGDIEYKDMEFTCDKTYNIFVKYLDEDGKSPIPSQSSGTRPFSSPDCVPPTVEPPPDLAIQTGGVAQSAPPTPTAIP